MQNIIEVLNWRYATKKFDTTKKISEADFETLLEALRLSPSSHGIQPWKFFVVQNSELREKLKEHSFGQSQVTDASHYIVFAVPTKLDEKYIEKYVENICSTRGIPRANLEQLENMMKSYILPMNEEKSLHHSALQSYIALGNILTVSAIMGIDTCVIGGLVPSKYDEILGLEEKGYRTVVACAFGYRSDEDKYSKLKKVRFQKEDVIEIIK